MNSWVTATVITVKYWTENLFSIFLRADISSFYAGQFTQLSVYNPQTKKQITRAYSYVNAPSNQTLEFYIIRIQNGKLSNILYNLKKNDKIFIKKKSFGFFTLKEVPCCKFLWMFATGTAIGPYLSMLQEEKNIDRFKKIILIHAVRYYNDLSYLPLMNILEKKYLGILKIQTVTSREKTINSLTGRIPFLLNHSLIENKIKLSINASDSHIMLCGNPNMVKETYIWLSQNKNMKKNLRRSPGHITMERYW